MLAKTYGSALCGVDAFTITIEVSVGKGQHYFITGLPDSAVKESITRIETAIKHNDMRMPRIKIVVNLAPADIRKEGSAYDLPIALGILGASGQVSREGFADFILMGELSLDGSVMPVRGALPMAVQALKDGFKGLILPRENAREAAIVNKLTVYGVSHLKEVVDFFQGSSSLQPVLVRTRDEFQHRQAEGYEQDFADVRGQVNIKRALEIAAAGGHNVILIGPPGAGKTMLAKRLPSILPPLDLQEALETTKIHSVAGTLKPDAGLVHERPFRAPHHTVSDVALVGGGTMPQPGEISLAHNGVLFLDELPEFKRSVLEVLRQPMEDRKVCIARARISVEYPASFMLIASMNPCPCGFYNHPERECLCSPGVVQRYLNRISGPLLDRIDLHVEVTPVSFRELSGGAPGEDSRSIRERVEEARKLQRSRFREFPRIFCNAQMPSSMLREACRLSRPASSC